MSWTLLNTRPAHQARPLTEAARSLGYEVIECPTLYIACLPCRQPVADIWIFTSVNAVRCWMEQHHRLPRGRLIAIGPRTAELLEKHGASPIFALPREFRSESVLKMALFDPKKRPEGEAVAIVKGEGGRTLLRDALRQRGWNVQEVACYRRVRRPLCAGWEAFRQAHRPLVLAMSMETVEALEAALPEPERVWLHQLPVLALSTRIAETLQARGWRGEVAVAKQQDTSGMISLLEQWKQKND